MNGITRLSGHSDEQTVRAIIRQAGVYSNTHLSGSGTVFPFPRITAHVKCHCPGLEGYLIRVQASFIQTADDGIRLHVCPTSNIMLSRVESYGSHPIRQLYDYGVPVTINTDDLLIFDQTVSEEYLNLYRSGLMTAAELNAIREEGLKAYGPGTGAGEGIISYRL